MIDASAAIAQAEANWAKLQTILRTELCKRCLRSAGDKDIIPPDLCKKCRRIFQRHHDEIMYGIRPENNPALR